VLVEADHRHEVRPARLQRAHRRGEGDAAGGAAVLHGRERHTGEAQPGDERVRFARDVAAADGEVHVGPADAGVGERASEGVLGHVQPADPLVPAEGMHARADHVDVVRSHASSSSGVKA
jgi:hypothetical protein